MVESIRHRTALLLVACLALTAVGCGSSRRAVIPVSDEDVEISSLAILPVPSQAVPAAKQEALLKDISEAFAKRYDLTVMTGLTLSRAVWGDLGSGSAEAAAELKEILAEAKDAYQRLIFGKVLRLLAKASEMLPVCGAEIRDPQVLTDIYMYKGLALSTLEKVEEAEAAFRQLVSFDNDFQAPRGDLFRPEQIEALERARRQLLSGNAFKMEVLSWPEGGTVFIDGRKIGRAPQQGIPLYLGWHFVRVDLPGHASYKLNVSDEAPPESVKAWLFPRWPEDDPPEDLMEEFTDGEPFSDASYEQLLTLAENYKVDAVLIVQFGRKGKKKIEIAARLFTAQTQMISGEGVYNLGARKKIHRVRIKHLVRVFKELGKKPKKKHRKKPQKKPKHKPKPEPKKKVKPEPKPKPKPEPKKKPRKKRRRKKKKKRKKPLLEEPPDV